MRYIRTRSQQIDSKQEPCIHLYIMNWPTASTVIYDDAAFALYKLTGHLANIAFALL